MPPFRDQIKERIKEVASLPIVRLRHWYRREYGLAPTDPRYLRTTDQQIELELLLALGAKTASTDEYVDPDYEAQEKEAQNAGHNFHDNYT